MSQKQTAVTEYRINFTGEVASYCSKATVAQAPIHPFRYISAAARRVFTAPAFSGQLSTPRCFYLYVISPQSF
ncbi:unnamed protein product [Leptosia nina]|uniref:Uncharacterized protein n=1 Tax=Leptosia nina TaxID=320188 RepID=A0AAV1JLS2_9NEOP